MVYLAVCVGVLCSFKLALFNGAAVAATLSQWLSQLIDSGCSEHPEPSCFFVNALLMLVSASIMLVNALLMPCLP